MRKTIKSDGKKRIAAGAFIIIIACMIAMELCVQDEKGVAAGAVSAETKQTDFMQNTYDTGTLEGMSLEEILEYLKPTAVQLYHAADDGGYTAASGFLIEITENTIYVCTNRHVIEDYDDWDVFFYDGTKACGYKTGVSSQYDVGVVQVEAAELSDELLQQLMTVHIDMTYWEQLGTEELEVGLVRVGQNGDVLHILTGKLFRKETEFLWGNGEKETELKIEQSDGDSGSAIFDLKGNLISMSFGTSHDAGGDRNWGIPLKAIVTCYEEITGRELLVCE